MPRAGDRVASKAAAAVWLCCLGFQAQAADFATHGTGLPAALGPGAAALVDPSAGAFGNPALLGAASWYEGRADDMLKVGGEWVSPIEIENALMEHPAVREAAVVGVPIESVMRIRAVIITDSQRASKTSLKAELQEWCKARLQRFQYPHIIDFVDELPKTATGKIQRFRLREVG